jgi:hypothetical protein
MDSGFDALHRPGMTTVRCADIIFLVITGRAHHPEIWRAISSPDQPVGEIGDGLAIDRGVIPFALPSPYGAPPLKPLVCSRLAVEASTSATLTFASFPRCTQRVRLTPDDIPTAMAHQGLAVTATPDHPRRDASTAIA